MLLTDFEILRPEFETSQEEGLDWLVDAHVKASQDENLRASIKESLWRVGCKPAQIAKRGHVLPDFLHRDWEKMKIYRLHEQPEGKNLTARSQFFQEEVVKVFEKFYPENALAPDDMIHVTCTGYVSPSGAQVIVSQREWGALTTVTHAYHMGCYASIPAIRMGQGFLLSDPCKKRADIVHTELCTLHNNPLNHNLDQLVCQTLFADGFIKYSMLKTTDAPHFRLIAIREETIPHSLHAMTWTAVEWGFQMGLSREIPVLINREIKRFVETLCNPLPKNALFAVHPGGPKILNYAVKALGVSEEQMAFSFQILKEYGNMSSATLPHIWEKILKDPGVPNGTLIISLAFGPGLSISGAVMEKVCG